MSVSQTQHTMDVEDTATMYGAELCISDGDEKHAANVDGLWLTLGEVEEIYTVVVEGDIDKRGTYPLDELSSIIFHHNYDDTYTLDNVVTLDADEWEDICEWFMERLGDDGYVNDFHEYLEEKYNIADIRYSDDGRVDIGLEDNGGGIDFPQFDVRVRYVDGAYTIDGDIFITVEGSDVEEITENL